MRRAVFAFLLCLAAPVAAHAQGPVSDADRAQIQSVIGAQLDAFRADNGDRAFSYASPHIRSIFGDPAHFMAMVAQGFPPVRHPQTVEFTELTTEDGDIVQHVELTGQNGAPALALYHMEREADGSWRIDGCELTESAKVQT